MAKHNGLVDPKLGQCFLEQGRVRSWGPQATGSGAVAVTWPVDDNDTVVLREPAHEAVDYKVFDHRAIAVDENNSLTLPALKVMQPDATHGQELADGGMLILSSLGSAQVVESRGTKSGSGADQHRAEPAEGRRPPRTTGRLLSPNSPSGTAVMAHGGLQRLC
jgi:hypothetical protein